MASRMALVALVMAGGLVAGCDRHETTENYDPRVDGVSPTVVAQATPHILDDPLSPSYPRLGGRPISVPSGGGSGTTTGPEVPSAPPTVPDAVPIQPPPDPE